MMTTKKALINMIDEALKDKFGESPNLKKKLSVWAETVSETDMLEKLVDIKYSRTPIKDWFIATLR
jgi:hypothetical protein